MSASVSLTRLAMSRACCPGAWLAESGSERTHAAMSCSSIYESALSTDQSGGLRPGPTGAPCPKGRIGCECTSIILPRPAIGPHLNFVPDHADVFIVFTLCRDVASKLGRGTLDVVRVC